MDVNVIEALCSKEWRLIDSNKVSIDLAEEILRGQHILQKSEYLVVARIQILLVDSGQCTDKEFCDALRGLENG